MLESEHRWDCPPVIPPCRPSLGHEQGSETSRFWDLPTSGPHVTRGIVGTIQLAVTLAFAAPIGLFGLHAVLAGDTLVGGAALAVAGLMLAIEEFLVTPGDLPERALGTVVDAVTGRDEE